MYKVLIVDDEKNIREGLKVIIDWASFNCEVIADVDDGLLGYDAVKALRPDIIISDIKMPNLDGIDMIKRLKSENIPGKFIILSGHSEFDYAKSAITLGVKSYLLKPLEEEHLEKCLTHILHELERENKEKNEINQLKTDYINQSMIYRSSVLRDIVDGYSDSNEDIKNLLQLIQMRIEASDYTCGVISIESELSTDVSTQLPILEKELNMNATEIRLFLYRKDQIACIIYNNPRRQDFYYDIHYKTDQILNTKTTLAVGRPYKHLNGLGKSFSEAQNALSYKLIKGNNSVIIIENVEKLAKSSNMFSTDMFNQLTSCIEHHQKDAAKKLIQDYFCTLSHKKDVSLLDLKLNCLYFIIPILREHPNLHEQMSEIVGQDIMTLNSIFRFLTYDELINWFINIINTIMDYVQSNKKKDTLAMIDKIKLYIKKNYAQNITLSSIADTFYINPYYLSNLFKSKTGTNYLQYLTKVRVEVAKDLLETSDLKIYEIAEQIGYGNPKYFSTVFEKHMGMKPSEYKRASRKPNSLY